jgi:hypothetical protein
MRRAVVLIFLALALAACQQQVKPDQAALTANRTAFDQIRTGQGEAVLAQLPPGPKRDQTAAALEKLKTVIPSTPPLSATPVVANVANPPGGRVEALVVEYDFPDRTVRFATTLVEPKGTQGWKIANYGVLEATHKELALNTLSLEHRAPAQLVFFALAITSPLLMLAALIKVLRAPGLQNRWLWAAFSLVGLFTFQMNWATGAMLIQWTTLQIVGFWMIHGASRFDAWMINATVPIGALLILGGLVARTPKATPSPAPAGS